jgi:hypothetical protein
MDGLEDKSKNKPSLDVQDPMAMLEKPFGADEKTPRVEDRYGIGGAEEDRARNLVAAGREVALIVEKLPSVEDSATDELTRHAAWADAQDDQDGFSDARAQYAKWGFLDVGRGVAKDVTAMKFFESYRSQRKKSLPRRSVRTMTSLPQRQDSETRVSIRGGEADGTVSTTTLSVLERLQLGASTQKLTIHESGRPMGLQSLEWYKEHWDDCLDDRGENRVLSDVQDQ